MDFLLLGTGGDREPLLQGLGDFLEVANLGTALGKPLAEFADHTAFEVLAFDGPRMKVSNLEALDGTPIVDVKPLLSAEISER